MLNKEAIIICLDLNNSTKNILSNGESFFNLSRNCIEQILQRKIFSESKDEFALVLFGTPQTVNHLSHDEFYSHITIARDFGPVDLRFLQYFIKPLIDNKIKKGEAEDDNFDIKPSQVNEGDFLEALVVCLDVLVNAFPKVLQDEPHLKDPLSTHKRSPKKKSETNVDRRIILFSNLKAPCSTENQLLNIIESFSKEQIKLNVVGVDLDQVPIKTNLDESQQAKNLKSAAKLKKTKSRKSQTPSPTKTIKTEVLTQSSQSESTVCRNMRLVHKMISKLSGRGPNGVVQLAEWFTFDQVMESVSGSYLVKSTRSVAQKFLLSLGTEFKIPVRGYYRMKRANFPQNWKLSRTSKIAEVGDDEMKDFLVPDDYDEDDISVGQRDTKVTLKGSVFLDRVPAKKTVVMVGDESDTEADEDILHFKPDYVKAYRYGSSLIPFSKEDEDAAKDIENTKGLAIIGFTKSINVPKYNYLGDGTLVFVTEPEEGASHLAFSAFVNALFELDLVAVARYVFRKGSGPKIVALSPRIKINYECLVQHTLPYLEDLRLYKFPNFVESFAAYNSDHKVDDGATEEKRCEKILDALIDGMNLGLPYEDPEKVKSENEDLASRFNVRDEGDDDAGELLRPKYTPNPYFQRVLEALSTRAIDYLIAQPAVANPKRPKIDKTHKNENLTPENDAVKSSIPTNGSYLSILRPPNQLLNSPAVKGVFKELKTTFKLEDISKLDFKGRNLNSKTSTKA